MCTSTVFHSSAETTPAYLKPEECVIHPLVNRHNRVCVCVIHSLVNRHNRAFHSAFVETKATIRSVYHRKRLCVCVCVCVCVVWGVSWMWRGWVITDGEEAESRELREQ